MSAARGERPAADRASFDRLTAALDGGGRRYRLRGSDHLDGQCPAHDDGRASLSADFHPAAGDLPGRVMLRCHAGCAAEDVVAALGLVMADLYDGPAPRRSAPSPRRVSARPAAKPARKPAAKQADHRCRWEPVTTYPYCDENGAVIGEVIRQCCARCGAKNFPVRRPALPTDDPARVRDGWVYRWPAQRPLYRLPEVLAAARAGVRVFVVEGEKDAEALAELGAVATCNPGGADNGSGGKWRREHTAALAGAAVVIVADRDAAGYRHAEYVRGQLAAVAAVQSVRVVEAAAGKDAADHLAAGRGVGELVAIDPAAKLAAMSAPAPVPSDDDAGQGATVVPGPWPGEAAGGRKGGGSGGSGGSGGGDRVPMRKIRQDFRVIDGELCHVIDDTATVVLDADARVQARLFRDMGDPEGRRGPDGRPVEPEVTHVRLSVTALDMPDPWVSLPEWDDFRGGTWVRDCPVPLSFEDTAKGRARLWTAVQRVSGRGVPRVPVHGALGWRRDDESGRPFYVHAGGVLGAEGPEAGALVAVPELLAEHVLPEPVSDPAGLRECLAASLRALEELPDHVAAPVLGFAYRVPLGWLRPALYPVGPKSSGKTGLGALAMQHFQPGARQSSKWARPGDKHLSVIGTYAALYAGMHAPLMVDDSAPDRRSAPVSEWVSETLRTQYNGNTRAVASRDGSLARRPARARGGLIITGEMPSSTDSANSRAMFVPVSRSDELGPALAELDRDGMPEARLALMASYVAWLARRNLAPDCQRLHPAVQERRDSLRDGLMGELGGDMRLAEATADYLTGWHYLLMFAVEAGAVEPGESAGLWRRVRAAMLTAAHRQDVAAETDPATRVLGLLREAFMTGAAYLTSEDGDSPPSDALALGWESVTSTGGGLLGGGPSVSYRFRGERIGVRTNHGRVWLLPGPAAAAVNREARDSGDPLDLAPHALAAILDDAGHLRTSTEAGTKNRARRVRMFGGNPRVWDLPAAALLGNDQADDDGPAPVDPAPEPPPADDLPGGPDDPLCEVCGCQILAGVPGQTTHPMCSPADDGPGQILETGGERCADSAASGAPDQRPRFGSEWRSVATEGKPPSDPAAAAAPRFEAPAVVVDGSGGWLPDGRRVPLPGRLESLADLLGWAEGLRLGLEHEHAMPDDGQVWLMPAAAARLGLPEDKPETDAKGHRALAAARAAGWTVAELRSWMWAYRRGGRTLGVAVAGWMPPADHPMLAGAPDARQLAARLGLWVARAGLSYRLTAGVTGLDLLDVLPRRVRLEDREAPAPVRPATISTLEDDYLWQRPPTPEETRLGWVHAYDANAMYLSAAAQVDLGMGAARHIGEPCEFDPTLPGYWRIEPGSWDDRLLPDLLDPMCRGRRWRSQWFTTPTLRRLAALGYAVEPLEAHVWDERSRFLLPWSDRLRDARAALMAPELADDADARAVLAEVKFCYAMGVGMLGKPPAKGRPRPAYYRPHWRHAVIAEARANLARKLHTAAEAGRFPLAIATDCVLYASDSADPAAALPPGFRMDKSGRQLGHVKPAGSARMADVAALLAASPRPDRPGNVFEIVEG